VNAAGIIAAARLTIAELVRERDEARRMLCSTWAAEWGSVDEVVAYAAKQWGRDAALALWPDDVLAKQFDHLDPEDRAEAVAAAKARA
jgi:hypothetical protein